MRRYGAYHTCCFVFSYQSSIYFETYFISVFKNIIIGSRSFAICQHLKQLLDEWLSIIQITITKIAEFGYIDKHYKQRYPQFNNNNPSNGNKRLSLSEVLTVSFMFTYILHICRQFLPWNKETVEIHDHFKVWQHTLVTNIHLLEKRSWMSFQNHWDS